MDEVPWYVHMIIAWLPFLFLIGLGMWITRSTTAALRTNDRRPLGQVIDDHLRELRRPNDMLEQALKDYRQRLEALEQGR